MVRVATDYGHQPATLGPSARHCTLGKILHSLVRLQLKLSDFELSALKFSLCFFNLTLQRCQRLEFGKSCISDTSRLAQQGCGLLQYELRTLQTRHTPVRYPLSNSFVRGL